MKKKQEGDYILHMDYNGNKGFRLLSIYERLNKGEILEKTSLAEQFNVTPKTIQRDMDDLRTYLAENYEINSEIKYNKVRKGYHLTKFGREWLTNEEVLTVCKILLESRALQTAEMQNLINKLLVQSLPVDQKIVEEIIRSEFFCYVPLQHGKKLLNPI